MGKTAYALSIAERAAIARNVGTLVFSLEMSSIELGERLIAAVARVDGGRLKSGTLSDAEIERIDAAIGGIEEAPLWIEDAPARTVTQIAAVTRRIIAKGLALGRPLGLVVIDYLQLVTVEAESRRSMNREQQVAEMCRRIKVLARDCGVPVVLLSQLNRGNEGRADPTPRMSDLRESGSIEQDADVVMLLHRPEYYDPAKRPGEADVIIDKNRHGPTGVVPLAFRKAMGRFESLARRDGPF